MTSSAVLFDLMMSSRHFFTYESIWDPTIPYEYCGKMIKRILQVLTVLNYEQSCLHGYLDEVQIGSLFLFFCLTLKISASVINVIFCYWSLGYFYSIEHG